MVNIVKKEYASIGKKDDIQNEKLPRKHEVSKRGKREKDSFMTSML
jgi:hypothetical protein